MTDVLLRLNSHKFTRIGITVVLEFHMVNHITYLSLLEGFSISPVWVSCYFTGSGNVTQFQ